MAYITCKNLTLGYEDGIVAENINFEVNPGDYLCIVGENGAGKSTLIKTLLHLHKPVAGELVMGDGITSKEIGYLPQQTVVQKDFPASVWEIVLSGTLSGVRDCADGEKLEESSERRVSTTKRSWRPWYGRAEKALAMKNLERMGIAELKKKCYRNLSGGQQQRVLLARALCATSKLLLLDEPVAGLDPKATEEFYGLLKKLNEEGLSVIMVSHDIQAAVKNASHILHIEKESSFYGKTEVYTEREQRNG